MTPELMPIEDNRSSSEIESDIRETRSRMDSTLDELGNRLTARSLLNSALDWWDSPQSGNQGGAAVRKAAATLGNQAKRHPMPAVLIGAGVAWLISESRDHDAETPKPRAYRPAGNGNGHAHDNHDDSTGAMGGWVEDKVRGVKDAASDAVDTVRTKSGELGDKMHHVTEQMSNQAHVAMDRGRTAVSKLNHEVRDGYQVGARKFTQACDEYPLAVGIGFAALGALAGLVIPRTRQEDNLMGEQSDKLVAETKDKANELLETGKDVGSRVLETVKEEAREQGLTGENVADTLNQLADRGGQILQKAKDEAVQVASEKGLKLPEKSSEQPPTF